MPPKTQHLLSAPPLGLLIALATPNSVAFFIQSFVSMTEVWVIGTLGAAPLAAIALAFPLLMLMQTLPSGALGGAVASSIARALGAGNTERAERLIWHALVSPLQGPRSYWDFLQRVGLASCDFSAAVSRFLNSPLAMALCCAAAAYFCGSSALSRRYFAAWAICAFPHS